MRRPTATPSATETLTIPASVVPGLGGLHVELSSTAMVGLGEGARYLVEYPYGCAEQRGSRTLALVLAADLGDAFSLPGMDTAKMRPAAQQNLKELEKFQCPDGGFCVLARRLPLHVAVPHGVPPARVQDRRRSEVPGRYRHARARLCLPRAGARRRAADERRMVAVLHRVAGVRRQGARRRRPQSGLEPDAALRLSRPDAGVRARVPPRCAGRARRDVSRFDRPHRRSPPPHAERDPARSRQRARRGAERSVSALVLELQRPFDVDRAQLARARPTSPTRRSGRWCAG